MPHENRPEMNPPPKCTFDQVFGALGSEVHKKTTLLTTGKIGKPGTAFVAEAKLAQNAELHDKRFISLPHSNRIYACCWGNTQNHMGKDVGQRINQYARPLDEWAAART